MSTAGSKDEGVDENALPNERQEGGDVRLIARAASILRALCEQPNGASLGELAKATGIPRSTVQRLVNALEKERLVSTGGPHPGVRLGNEIARMGAFVERDARDVLRSFAGDLLARFRETVDVTFLDDDRAVVIESLASTQVLRADSFVGARLPLHCTAHGKAHLSMLEPSRRRELLFCSLDRLKGQMEGDPDKVLAEIEASAKKGYFVDISQTSDGVSAVAIALEDMPDYSIGLVVPSQRFDANIDAYVTKLLEIRTSLSTASRRFPVRRN